MYQYFKNVVICALIAGLIGLCGILADRQSLCDGLIRFHVVANSDGEEDQQLKLKVRDAVLNSIRNDLAAVANISEARRYLTENLSEIREIVNQTLSANGYPQVCQVSLGKEHFDVRHYETFSLPAGVYESLRIVIGKGNGKNWWCVTFPALCLPATSSEFESTAAAAGFSKPMVKTLSGNPRYTIRFYLLDRIGQLENMFYQE